MSPKKLAVLVEDARLALLAGVVLTRRDWVRMTDEERAAWCAARAILQPTAKDAPVAASPVKSAAPSHHDLVRKALEEGARECLGSEA